LEFDMKIGVSGASGQLGRAVVSELLRTVVGIQASFAAGAFDIVTGDVERLGGRPPKPLRDVLAGALKAP